MAILGDISRSNKIRNERIMERTTCVNKAIDVIERTIWKEKYTKAIITDKETEMAIAKRVIKAQTDEKHQATKQNTMSKFLIKHVQI